MPNRTVRTNEIPADAISFVSGTVLYSHIASLIDGDELAREQQRDANRGGYPEQRPYTRINIGDAQVCDQYGNPKDPQTYSVFDRYNQEHMFMSSQHPENGTNFVARNRSANLPAVCVYDASTKHYNRIRLDAELDRGVPVILALQCFQPRNASHNKGITLRAILLPQGEQSLRTRGVGGEARFFAQLQQLGLIVDNANATDDYEVVETGIDLAGAMAPSGGYAPAPQPQAMPTYPNTTTVPLPQAPAISYTPVATPPLGPDPAMQQPNYGTGGVGLNNPLGPDEY